MSKFDYSKCFCDFSLILLIFIFLTYPIEMDNFSHSLLGKFCAVILIAYYTIQNIMYGLLFCIVVIYYYQIHHTKHLFSSNFEAFNDYVPEENNNQDTENFIKKHCDSEKITYNGFVVNQEMKEHVFPELKTHSNCNPCDPMCKFSISNRKLITEDEIIKPKSSNDWFSDIIQKFSK
jgi:hypothetical protein